MSELIDRRAAHRAYNLTLENTLGSGYHDRDTDPTDRSRLVAPQHNGLPRLSEHVIAFFDHDYDEAVYFVGPDATSVLSSLQSWCKKNTPKEVHDPMPGTYRKILKHVPRLGVVQYDGADMLKLWLSEWNDFLFALGAEGVGISGAPLEPDGTTP